MPSHTQSYIHATHTLVWESTLSEAPTRVLQLQNKSKTNGTK